MRALPFCAALVLLASVSPVWAGEDSAVPSGRPEEGPARAQAEPIPSMLVAPSPAAVIELPGSPVDAAPSVNGTAPVAAPEPFELPRRDQEIPHRFCLGVYRDVPVPDDLERVRATVLEAAREWKLPAVSLAWYAPGKKAGQGVALSACTLDGVTVEIRKAGGDAEALDLERRLALPISPRELSRIYQENEVVADDDFKGRPVLFESEVADIARGAYGRPYVFFPAEPGGVSGLTCYFDAKDPALRKLRKGARVVVRAEVKGFLMQDVILDKCVVVEIKS